MNGLFDAASRLQAFCDARGWLSCFIGGIAVQRWGEPRVTRYADLTLLTGFGREAAYIDPLLAEFPARLSDARDLALRARVLLLSTAEGIALDCLARRASV